MNKFSEYVNTEELKKTRLKRKLNYKDMAEMLGFKSEISYYNLEVGIVEPKITQMIRISEILGRPVQKFFNLKLQEN
ncbi:MAG: helix-turn-helix transcriptional regulator [Clostridia bacterium]|nr:helix-turn-helix transcriptional regulator [Clostridia bacterium]